MPDVIMQRDAVKKAFQQAQAPHAGLWLARGLPEWKQQKDKKGEDFQQHIDRATRIKAPAIYQKAYERWQAGLLADNAQLWCGKVDGRLFIGSGGASVLETAITLSHTYGVPVIPGSAVKGLARAYADTQEQLTAAQKGVLFGKDSDTPQNAEAGYVLFHDAWWIPETQAPLAAEVITVHHQDYYGAGGSVKNASDFDSPIPTQHIAARGSFLFALQCGDDDWAEYAMNLLKVALQHWGIGGKTAAGYGRFVESPEELSEFRQQLRDELEALGFSGAGKAGELLVKAEKEVATNPEEAIEIAQELKRYYKDKLKQWDNGNAKQRKRQDRIEKILV